MADVICPSCNERIHQTTEHYRPDLPPNGKMFRLKDFYRENGWSSFIEDESSIGENLCCPDCQGPYPEGAEGRVRVDKDQYIAELLDIIDYNKLEKPVALSSGDSLENKDEPDKIPCPHCGEMFKRSGLHFHIKAKHPEA